MFRIRPRTLAASFALVVSGCQSAPAEDPQGPFAGRSLEVFVGTASKPPTEAAIAAFTQRTGARVEAHYGGSGRMLADMVLTRRGDLYFPGSSDYMALAEAEGVIASAPEPIVYLLPAILVPQGNPRALKGLKDLSRPGLRVGIGRPDSVCVGLYAVELLEAAGLAEAIRPNLVTYADSCEHTAQLLALGAVDAIIGWEVFEDWAPEATTSVPLPPSQIPRVGFIPIARTTFARDPDLADAFIAFLKSPDGQAFYRDAGYLTSREAALARVLPTTPVGGVWSLPRSWR